MNILVLDNYDSFTYNLVQLLKNCPDANIAVHRNDKITLEEIKRFDKIVLSPGPGIPQEAGILNQLIKMYSPSKSILGVCLGHQAIAEVFNARLVNLDQVHHGVATNVNVIKPDYLFEGIPEKFKAGRYHSWVVDEENFPDELEITMRDDRGCIMSLRHKKFDVRGVQFHPESILTEHGDKIIQNWISEK